MRKLLIFLMLGLLITPALAVEPDEVLDDPVMEARARDLSAELRCMVCQNQSIDESNAPLARDLRLLVRERIVAGDSNEDVLTFLVARYGEFVLLKPRFNMANAILWIAPLALLILAAGIAFASFRTRRNQNIEEQPLSDAEHETLKKILSADS
uniref:cytochrome c-type biogenesis protein n=1 Tax=Pararhizobium sp. IMCC3301 TaxID=3067904 RepID=UPI002740F014|nr:cytochrome c-type biogenesis protein [Pararhizobium sp. IMCC3301]